MISITLPDKKVLSFEEPAINAFDVVNKISVSLSKSAIAAVVNDNLVDLGHEIKADSCVKIISDKDEEGLEVIRHSAAHILAQAVQRLYSNVQVAIGPVIDNGFFYDFVREQSFNTEDLAKIEAEMDEIVKLDYKITREVLSRKDAIEFFAQKGEHCKVETIKSIDASEDLSLYRQGEFVDLCRGPHVPSTGRVKAVKLLKVAGAYWRGDSNNKMLQRIYGTAWARKSDLECYLKRLEEAKERDHRKLGKQMDLFHLQEEAKGSVFWHEHGYTLYRLLQDYIRQKLCAHGYFEVKTPILVDRKLWEESGHWDKFRENMFISESDDRVMAIKPMNCPCHVQIFKQDIRSYKDLPLRMAEFGTCHRNESSGSLHGLLRVREFVQDDAHIFCTKEQLTSETLGLCDLLKEVYSDLGFTDILIKFSDRPDVRAGSDKMWDEAESSLLSAIDSIEMEYALNKGEGAFYGPKLEFVLQDCLGRKWQCGTLQVDFVLPERLDAVYVSQDGSQCRPVMLHRAIIGTFERFIGILLEHHNGRLPIWLSPIQVVVVNITSAVDEYAKTVFFYAKSKGIRAIIDIRNEQVSYKIRKYSLKKIPFIWVLGKNEEVSDSVSVKKIGTKESQVVSLECAVDLVLNNKKEVVCQ